MNVLNETHVLYTFTKTYFVYKNKGITKFKISNQIKVHNKIELKTRYTSCPSGLPMFKFLIDLFYSIVSMFYLHVSITYMHCPWRPEEGVRFLETTATMWVLGTQPLSKKTAKLILCL